MDEHQREADGEAGESGGRLLGRDAEDHEEEEEALTLVDKALIYSGYMTMGEKIFAVINGIEYRIGDIVEGFFLKKIDPMEIIMEKNGRPMRIPFKRID